MATAETQWHFAQIFSDLGSAEICQRWVGPIHSERKKTPLWAAVPSVNLNVLLRSQGLQETDCLNPKADNRHRPEGARPFSQTSHCILTQALLTWVIHEQSAGAWHLLTLCSPFCEAANPAFPSQNTQVQTPQTPLPSTNKYLLRVYFHPWPLFSSRHSNQSDPCKYRSDLVSVLLRTHPFSSQRLPNPKFSQWLPGLCSLAPCHISDPFYLPLTLL